MTGYGEFKIDDDYATINVEIKSLNSRFFDFYIKSGKILSMYDNEARNKVKLNCSRGSFQLKASIEIHNNDEMAVDESKVLNYLRISKQIQDLKPVDLDINDLSVDKLLSIPDIYQSEDNNYELIQDLYLKCIDGAILELNNSRINEGNNIQISLEENISFLDSQMEKISELSKTNINDAAEKYNDKIKNLIKDVELDQNRLYQEIAIMIEKKDIDEELVRLNSHSSILKKYLSEDGQVGKKINFMLQEIGREVNTISSKSNNVDITYRALNMKNELEKIREQAQNIL